MSLQLENKQGLDGKDKQVYVYETAATPPPADDPSKVHDKMIQMYMKTETEELINTIRQLGGTDGKGGSQNAGSINDTSGQSGSQEAAQNAVQVAQKLVEASQTTAHRAAQQVQLTQKPVEAAKEVIQDELEKLKAAQTEQAKNYLKVKEVHEQGPNLNADQQSQLANHVQNLNDSTKVVEGLKEQIQTHAQSYKLAYQNHTEAVNNYLQAKDGVAQPAPVESTEAPQKVGAVNGTDDGVTGTDNSGKGAKDPAPSPQKKDLHKFLKDHNVFWDLLQVSMGGNASVYGILTASLGKISNLLAGNQYATGIITNINNDLKELAALSKPGDQATQQQLNVMYDLKKQLMLLENIANPDRSDFSYPSGASDAEKKKLKEQAQQAHDSLGSLNDNLSKLVQNYKDEFSKASGGKTTGGDMGCLQYMIDLTYGDGETSKGSGVYKSTDKNSMFKGFYSDMIAESGSSPADPTVSGIYASTPAMVTSLNTSGSQFMAQQNLQTQQVKQVEGVFTSGMSTAKSVMQSIVGNISN